MHEQADPLSKEAGMEFRIHLTSADLGKIRLLPNVNPVIETSVSALLMRTPTSDPFVRRWRARAASALGPAAALSLQVVSSDLVQVTDVLYRHALKATTYAEAVEAFLATPGRIINRDLTHALGDRPSSARERDLCDGNTRATRAVAAHLLRYHRAVIEPQWNTAVRYGKAAFGAQRRGLAENGVDWLLGSLHPSVRWQPPVLTIHAECGVDHGRGPCPFGRVAELHGDIFLEGRGLVLIPVLFIASLSCVFWYPDFDDEPGILMYPATADRTALEGANARQPGQLAPLLGSTRAAVMEALADRPRTTTELARSVNVSIASASEHTAVLRRACLVVSHREGMSVIHSLTETGLALLDDTA